MKKLLSVMLVLALVLCFSAGAFAFTDTTDLAKDQQTSISKVTALGIVNGYPDNTYRAAGNITRAEFAKMAAISVGLGDAADLLKSTPSQFKDVKANEWYTGYINVCSSKGMIKGYPDGSFKPNGTITNAEVLTVLLRALGYNDNLPGPWPVDYISKAASLGITNGLVIDASKQATRGIVAQMIDETLNENVVYWDADKADFLSKFTPSESLLGNSFGNVAKESQIVNDYTVNSKGQWSLSFVNNDTAVNTPINDELLGGGYKVASDAVVSNGANFASINGKLVDFIVNDDNEIVFVDVLSSYASGVYSDWSDTANGYKNDKTSYYMTQEGYYVAAAKIAVGTLGASGNQAIGASLDADGDIYDIYAESDSNVPSVVKEYNSGNQRLTFYNGTAISLKDADVVVLRDGVAAKVTDIKAYDKVTVATTKGIDYVIKASSAYKSGKVEAYYGSVDTIKIDGVKYDLGAAYTASVNGGDDFNTSITTTEVKDLIGTTVKFALNDSGNINVIIGDTKETATNFAIVTRAIAADAVTGNEYITIFTADGKKVSMKLESDYKVTNGPVAVNSFIEYEVDSNNEITDITVRATAPVVTKVDSDNDRITVGGVQYKLTSNVVIFNTYMDGTDKKYEMISNDKYIDWLADGAVSGAPVAARQVAYVDINNNAVEVIFVNSGAAAVGATASDYAIVKDLYFTDAQRADVVINGVVKSYEVKGAIGSVAKKDLVTYAIIGDKIEFKTVVLDASVLKTTAPNLSANTTIATTLDIAKKFEINKIVGGTDLVLDYNDGTVKSFNAFLADDVVVYDYSDVDAPVLANKADIYSGAQVLLQLDSDGDIDVVIIL